VTFSNVHDGARLAAERNPDIVVFDGSGAGIPPIDVDRRILVVGPGQDATAYMNAYRVLISDLVVGLGEADTSRICAVKDVPVVSVDLRLRPLGPLRGRRTAVFTTGPAPTAHLDADVVFVSTNLADRVRLGEDLAGADADVYLVEVKAAAIDVVAEAGAERGVEVVLAVNDVVSEELDRELEALVQTGAPA
jgi:cyclic 2,3-diphosphoglycerate synthetase